MIYQVYDVKIKGKRNWKRVRATSMKALSDYTKKRPEITDWRMVGIMSRLEMIESKTTEIVA